MKQENTVRRLTRADLADAAWMRYEAARDAIRAREALAAASKPFTEARNAYQRAVTRSEQALRTFEETEQRMLLQESAQPVRAVAS